VDKTTELLTIFFKTLFEDGERVEGGRVSSDVANISYSLMDVSV
jgi:hypothetical protein